MTLPAVNELLPHTGRIVLLDQLTASTPDSVTCAVRLMSDSPFMRAGRVRAAVTLEYMAQAAAAFVGLDARQRGEPPRVGYVVSARNVALRRAALHADTTLTVTACITWRDVNTAAFSCRVCEGADEVASGDITVVQTG